MVRAFASIGLVLCLLSVDAAKTFAQVGGALLLPSRGDERLASQREVAQQALAEALATQGFRVVSHADGLVLLPPGAAACAAVDCAPNMLRALSLNVAAACAVWLSPDAPEGTVFVTLVDDAGARFPGAHPVHAGNLAVATRAALADARGLQLLGPGPWVRIHGKPAGAKVFIDDQLVGTLPHRAAMTAGRYDLRVEAQGHIPDDQTLDVPLNAGREVEVAVDLEEGDAPPVAREFHDASAPSSEALTNLTTTEREAQAGDYLLGTAFAVSGVLLLTIDPIPALVSSGDCADAACRRVKTFGARTALEAVGGAVLVATGAVIAFVWKPFALEVSASPQTSFVQLSTRF